MEWFITFLAIVVIGLAVVAATGRLGQFGPLERMRATAEPLPRGPLTADDIARARFQVVSRGYAMDQVDELLERIQVQLQDKSSQTGPGPGIMEAEPLSNRRNHDGSDETSHG